MHYVSILVAVLVGTVCARAAVLSAEEVLLHDSKLVTDCFGHTWATRHMEGGDEFAIGTTRMSFVHKGILVAKVTRELTLAFAARLECASASDIVSIADITTDSMGRAWLAGTFIGSLVVRHGVMFTSFPDIATPFFVLFSGDGTPFRAIQGFNMRRVFVSAARMDVNDTLVAVGAYSGAPNVADLYFPNAGTDADMYAVRLSPAGHGLDHQTLHIEGSNRLFPTDIAPRASGSGFDVHGIAMNEVDNDWTGFRPFSVPLAANFTWGKVWMHSTERSVFEDNMDWFQQSRG